jgi:hypothetical protein
MISEWMISERNAGFEMKKRSLLAGWIVTLMMNSPAWAGGDEVSIRLETHAPVALVRNATLKPEAGHFICKTPDVPWHRIHVRGLKSLKPPFRGKVERGTCPRVLTWGSEQKCYEAKEPLIEDLFRWCENI